MNDYCIVVTGLPASGKTTIGRKIAAQLGIPFLDKDDFLEELYDVRGLGDAAWRQRLSLESNDQFKAAAIQQNRVVLVSHWRPQTMQGPSGTPVDWLRENYQTVIELYCKCAVDVAAERFKSRIRHPGHLDSRRDLAETIDWLNVYQSHLPVGIGQQIIIDSTDNIDIKTFAQEIMAILSARGQKRGSLSTV